MWNFMFYCLRNLISKDFEINLRRLKKVELIKNMGMKIELISN